MKGKNIRKGITSVAILSLVLCLMSTGVMHAEDDETVFTPSQDQSAEEKTAAPTAAPGEALRPLAIVSYSALGSNCGCRS